MSKQNLSVINVKSMDLDEYGRSEIIEIMDPELLALIGGGLNIYCPGGGGDTNKTLCL